MAGLHVVGGLKRIQGTIGLPRPLETTDGECKVRPHRRFFMAFHGILSVIPRCWDQIITHGFCYPGHIYPDCSPYHRQKSTDTFIHKFKNRLHYFNLQ